MAISLIQSKSGNAGGPVTSFAVAYTSSVTAGNLLAAFVGAGSTAQTFSISDNINGSWTASTFSHGHGAAQIFYFPNSQAGSITVTVTNGISTNVVLSIAEVGGIVSTVPLDQTGSNSFGNATTSPIVSTTSATSNATEAVIAGITGNATVTWSNVGGTLISPASSSIAMVFFASSTAAVQTWNPTTSAAITGDAVINTFLPAPTGQQPQAIYARRYVQFYT